MSRLPRDPPQAFLDDPKGYVAQHQAMLRSARTKKPKYRGFAEGVKGYRPPRWEDAVALVKSGQATVAETAALIDVSRQRVQRWVTVDGTIDIRRYRRQFLEDLWRSMRKAE